MSDDIDLAQARDEGWREAAIRAARTAAGGEGRADCEDCGAAIDRMRRAALPSARRCMRCQEIAERQRRRQRGL